MLINTSQRNKTATGKTSTKGSDSYAAKTKEGKFSIGNDNKNSSGNTRSRRFKCDNE